MSKEQASTPTEEFVVPEGIQIKQVYGKLTGKTLYTVEGFEMPLQGTPEAAVRVYTTLKQAYETGYFSGGVVKKERAAKAAAEAALTSAAVAEKQEQELEHV
ncbi:glycosyl transferase family 2 [Novimethylophilus kurashikiensis]|uniref:Glycosyl transferase family 2 n=1 Tax=Novimethylophilus kurashikiensis TaxID=1825523 RepID=A0A2R5F7Q6_9PROT|nr:hypothetical protein [Novimethylophilus kurashikiensis]GBG14272.1 glycosyl transferase family 2 [Novimethylophilus kurashikiensis]